MLTRVELKYIMVYSTTLLQIFNPYITFKKNKMFLDGIGIFGLTFSP